MTWHSHLYGNAEHAGLISKLSQRAGLVRKLSWVMPPDRLRVVANGIFFSLLSYGLQIYGIVSRVVEYSEGSGRHTSLTRDDSHKIQVVMNVVLRALTMCRNSSVAAASCEWLPLIPPDVCLLYHLHHSEDTDPQGAQVPL